jgi:hypothetical protein
MSVVPLRSGPATKIGPAGPGLGIDGEPGADNGAPTGRAVRVTMSIGAATDHRQR